MSLVIITYTVHRDYPWNDLHRCVLACVFLGRAQATTREAGHTSTAATCEQIRPDSHCITSVFVLEGVGQDRREGMETLADEVENGMQADGKGKRMREDWDLFM